MQTSTYAKVVNGNLVILVNSGKVTEISILGEIPLNTKVI